MSDIKLAAGTSAATPHAQSAESSEKQAKKAALQSLVSSTQRVDNTEKVVALEVDDAQVKAEEQDRQEVNVQEAVSKLNDYIQDQQRNLRFSVDDESGETVVTVMDSVSDSVIRQIPDETVLRLARKLDQDEPLQLFSLSI